MENASKKESSDDLDENMSKKESNDDLVVNEEECKDMKTNNDRKNSEDINAASLSRIEMIKNLISIVSKFKESYQDIQRKSAEIESCYKKFL